MGLMQTASGLETETHCRLYINMSIVYSIIDTPHSYMPVA